MLSAFPLQSPGSCTTLDRVVVFVVAPIDEEDGDGEAWRSRNVCSTQETSRHSPGHIPMIKEKVNGLLQSAYVNVRQRSRSGMPLHIPIGVVVVWDDVVDDETRVVCVGVGDALLQPENVPFACL